MRDYRNNYPLLYVPDKDSRELGEDEPYYIDPDAYALLKWCFRWGVSKVRNKFLTYLEASYACVLGVNILLPFIGFHAQTRAVILLLTFLGVLFTHIIICLNRDSSKAPKSFFYLTSLWIIKFVVFVANEGLNVFFNKTILILDWIDFFILLVIALLVSISFLIKKPFWYIKIEGKPYFIFGIVLLLSLGLVTLVKGSHLD